ncbi:immunity protein Imm33 domain-containing protein [Roseateles sp. NT4]|uniref:immunity protein Imm33 domain-containing protein n=1 Tax=Roseateles sp. NT4 TaxID=3453715 RepID=UPI003EEB3D62
MPSWHLANADELAAQFRYTFFKPAAETLAKIAVGENVKLIFRFQSDDPEAPGAERMWVLVDEIGPDHSFRGRLDNDPRHIADLKAGDCIEFAACHIINTAHEEPHNIVERYIQRCFVTQRVLRDGVPAGYLYREEPEQEDDSGWRITANEESDEYMDDPDNSAYVSLGAVLNQDASFIHLLDSPAGSAFVRDTETGAFVACTD